MSDQEPGHGHHALTLNAVNSLFSDLPPGSKLMGLGEKEFFNKLDHWQGWVSDSVGGLHPWSDLTRQICIAGKSKCFSFKDGYGHVPKNRRRADN
jgi:hypothetical protein